MEETLTVHLPGEIRQMLNRTPEELARDLWLYAALMLFRSGKLSSGAAAEMAKYQSRPLKRRASLRAACSQ